jgi:hypothetical protein
VTCLAVLGLLCLPGCSGGGGVTKANFDKIASGQSLTDVEALMGGKGTEVSPDALKNLTQEAGKQLGEAADKFGQNKDAGDAGKLAKQGIGMVTGLMDSMGPKLYRWGDDNKNVIVLIVLGRVAQKFQNGL